MFLVHFCDFWLFTTHTLQWRAVTRVKCSGVTRQWQPPPVVAISVAQHHVHWQVQHQVHCEVTMYSPEGHYRPYSSQKSRDRRQRRPPDPVGQVQNAI